MGEDECIEMDEVERIEHLEQGKVFLSVAKLNEQEMEEIRENYRSLLYDWKMRVAARLASDSAAGRTDGSAAGHTDDSAAGHTDDSEVKHSDSDAAKQKIDTIRKDAEDADGELAYRMGCRYFSGDGKKQDIAEAAKCFLEAADKGNAEAQRALMKCYKQGHKTNWDKKQAMLWFEKQSLLGSKAAKEFLNECRNKKHWFF